LNVVVTVAPGVLSKYTAIIRLLPRYAVVNNLPYPVRIWQDSSTFSTLSNSELATSHKSTKWRYGKGNNVDSSKVNQYELLWGHPATLHEKEASSTLNGTTARGSALYIATIYPSEILPFCLPDSRGERQLRIDHGYPWNLTGSISTNKPGDFTLTINQTVDLKAIPHVSSRSNAQYKLQLPPPNATSFDVDLGIWFESEYGSSKGLIVKAIRKNSYAFNETEIHIGDELFSLNGFQLAALEFDEAMNILKFNLLELSSKRRNDANRGAPVKQGRKSIIRSSFKQNKARDEPLPGITPIVLVFRTIEERIRQVRLKASGNTSNRTEFQTRGSVTSETESNSASLGENGESSIFVHAELKSAPRSHVGLFLVLRDENIAPYQIQNQSVTYTIYYRQRECHHLNWQSLEPGKSRVYSWEEPLKPKRLLVRVASQSSIKFGENLWVETQTLAHTNRLGSDRRNKFLHSDEDVLFPHSIVIPLDEVGYHEVLPINSSSMKNENLFPVHQLTFDVDVNNSARILIIGDVIGDDGRQQMTQWLKALRAKIEREDNRQKDLRAMNNVLESPKIDPASEDDIKPRIESVAVDGDFLDKETNISGCHQIVAEILEARGLSSESLNASCNPYCEVRLKLRRNKSSKFSRKDRRKTYYIRNTVTPVWNNQSFVFQVPQEAAAVSRGYRLIFQVRNFRVLGTHQILGSSQVDLHSVRDQMPLVGWFPLVGRTGRRELSSHASHWGRGSIKLKVQWIYSIPALIDYFILLSERRNLAFNESFDVIVTQVDRTIEVEKGKQAELDGIQAVRMMDLIAFPKYKQREKAEQVQRQKTPASAVKRSSARPLVQVHRESIQRNVISESQHHLTELPTTLKPRTHELHGLKKFSALSKTLQLVHDLEDRIIQKRQNFQRFNSTRRPVDDIKKSLDGVIPISFIRSWNTIQALINDSNMEVKFSSDRIETTLRPILHPRRELDQNDCSDCKNAIAVKLGTPISAPSSMRSSVYSYIDDWFQSRVSFDRSARIAMETVLHPGGWLSFRPITALNLPDMFTGMAVKVKYGSETYTSETADVRSLDPCWYKVNRQRAGVDHWERVSQGDIHIHVPPQQTSGVIRLSIIGEKKHKRLSTKAELGVLYLPLGATISSCLDYEESRLEMQRDSLPMLVRWFPLIAPAIRIEGDCGLSTRPPDTEKENDSDFKEYFAPCIQLALFWSPDIVTVVENDIEDTSLASSSFVRRGMSFSNNPKLVQSPLVRNYFNADIGWISAALIDSQRSCELLSLNIKDVDLRYWVTTAKTRIGLTVGWLQIDYQDNNEREPVVLAPTPTDVLVPVLRTFVLKDNIRSQTDTLSFDFIDISIAELDFTVEERLLIDIMLFLSALQTKKKAKGRSKDISTAKVTIGSKMELENAQLNDTNNGTSLATILTSPPCNIDKKDKIYIRELVIGVIKVNISYLKGKTRDAMVDKPISKVFRAAGDELFQQFYYNDDNMDSYLAWSQSTVDDELLAQSEGDWIQSNRSTFNSHFHLFSSIVLSYCLTVRQCWSRETSIFFCETVS
jgi:C2 domain